MADWITKGGLIATFYGRRGAMKILQQRIGGALGLPKADPDFNEPNLSEPDKDIYLYRFDPPADRDATIVHLALNRSGEPSAAWDELRQELEKKNIPQILDNFAKEAKGSFWGYSLIYQATLHNKACLKKRCTREKILKPCRRLSGSSKDTPLGESKLKGAPFWLLDIPDKGEGAEAATVYLALLPAKKAEKLFYTYLYGANAALLMPDLIAHKGYYVKRQYVGERRKNYLEDIKKTQKIVNGLLDTLRTTTTVSNPGLQRKLGPLSAAYGLLLKTVPYLDERRLALAQQITNYEWWQEQLGPNPVISFHYKHLQMTHRDLDLLIGKGQSTMQTVDTVIQMAQTDLNQRRAQREKDLDTWIGVLGIAIMLTQLIESAAVKAFLEWFNQEFQIYLPTGHLSQFVLRFIFAFLIARFIGPPIVSRLKDK